jgi:hypothetical protein
MNTFWFGFFNQFRDCGRSAAWFLVTLGGSFVGLVLMAWAFDNGHGDSVAVAFGVFVLLMVCRLTAMIRRALRDRRHRLKFGGLSEDELKKARARLAQHRKTTRTLPASPTRIKTRAPVGEFY